MCNDRSAYISHVHKTFGFASYVIEVVKCEGFLLLWPILHSDILHRGGFQMLATL